VANADCVNMTHVPSTSVLLALQHPDSPAKPMSVESALAAKTLLLVDDDVALCSVLGGALRRRGLHVIIAHDIETALLKSALDLPDIAILDLNLNGHSSLRLIPELHARRSDIQILMLTGYASVTTAVEATKLGATAYLTKPANVDEILRALLKGTPQESPRPLPRPPPEDIDKAMQKNFRLVVRECSGNISAAARKLGMHRRSLQRKLKRGTTH
jgi:two-component system, response regulator RegA